MLERHIMARYERHIAAQIGMTNLHKRCFDALLGMWKQNGIEGVYLDFEPKELATLLKVSQNTLVVKLEDLHKADLLHYTRGAGRKLPNITFLLDPTETEIARSVRRSDAKRLSKSEEVAKRLRLRYGLLWLEEYDAMLEWEMRHLAWRGTGNDANTLDQWGVPLTKKGHKMSNSSSKDVAVFYERVGHITAPHLGLSDISGVNADRILVLRLATQMWFVAMMRSNIWYYRQKKLWDLIQRKDYCPNTDSILANTMRSKLIRQDRLYEWIEAVMDLCDKWRGYGAFEGCGDAAITTHIWHTWLWACSHRLERQEGFKGWSYCVFRASDMLRYADDLFKQFGNLDLKRG